VGCPAFFRLGDSRAEKTASLKSRRSLVISGLRTALWAVRPSSGSAIAELRKQQARDRGVAIDELSPLIRGGLIHSQLGDGFFGGEPDELVHSVGVGGRVIRVVGLLEDMGQRFGFAGTGGEEPRMA